MIFFFKERYSGEQSRMRVFRGDIYCCLQRSNGARTICMRARGTECSAQQGGCLDERNPGQIVATFGNPRRTYITKLPEQFWYNRFV